MGRRSDPVWALVDMCVGAITDRAIGFSEDVDGDIDIWLPFSEIDCLTDEKRGDVDPGDVQVDDFITHAKIPMWLAEAKGLDWDE